jgi:two-component system chemotaxis sensor kinase CheA
VRLREHFQIDSHKMRRESIVVVRVGERRAGFIVDELLGEHQTVIKPLSRLLSQVRGLAGSTILAEGGIALILDPPALMTQAVLLATRQSECDSLLEAFAMQAP